LAQILVLTSYSTAFLKWGPEIAQFVARFTVGEHIAACFTAHSDAVSDAVMGPQC